MAGAVAGKAALTAARSKTGRRIIYAMMGVLLLLTMLPMMLVVGAGAAFSEPPEEEESVELAPAGSIPVSGDWVNPLQGAGYFVSCEYLCYPGHFGIDLAIGAGVPIYAASSGRVSSAMYFGDWDYGWGVFIEHGGGIQTRYAHLVKKPSVSTGQMVKAGQLIGYVGSTGNSTGPHLHFETRVGGIGLNPRDVLRSHGIRF